MFNSIIITNGAALRAGALCWGQRYAQMLSGVLPGSDTKTRSWTAANKLETAVCLFPEAAEMSRFQVKKKMFNLVF